MISCRATYRFLEDGVHAKVLDLPGVISCGKDLEDARQMLRSALVDMAETSLALGETLPKPNPSATHPDSDLEEPIHLLLTAASRVAEVPQDAAP